MLNKVILIGRLGRDPETRYMPNARRSVTSASLRAKAGKTRADSVKRESSGTTSPCTAASPKSLDNT